METKILFEKGNSQVAEITDREKQLLKQIKDTALLLGIDKLEVLSKMTSHNFKLNSIRFSKQFNSIDSDIVIDKNFEHDIFWQVSFNARYGELLPTSEEYKDIVDETYEIKDKLFDFLSYSIKEHFKEIEEILNNYQEETYSYGL